MSSIGEAISGPFSTAIGAAGVVVTYHRGADWVELTALPGKTDFEVDDGNGVIVEYRSRDYLIRTCELELAGTLVEPKRGDQIKETVGNKIHTYEVMRPDGGEQVWKHADPTRNVIRVHTKLKGVTNL